MEKAQLRDNLFAKYFEVTDGVLATDLVAKLSFIPELWKSLHALCEKNVKHFDSYSDLEQFKLLEYNKKKYLILKLKIFKYIITDIEKLENISNEEIFNEFEEDFFVDNFNEIKLQDKNMRMYSIYNYNGNLQALVDFYIENQSIFSLPAKLHYKLELDSAWTSFVIDFVNGRAHLIFQTPDQFLYEQLFLRYDLSVSRMQDATSRIGIKRMQEIFEKIKEIRIPKEAILSDLYAQFLIQDSGCKHILEKIKTTNVCE